MFYFCSAILAVLWSSVQVMIVFQPMPIDGSHCHIISQISFLLHNSYIVQNEPLFSENKIKIYSYSSLLFK